MLDPLDQYDFLDTDFMNSNSATFAAPIGEYLINFSYVEHILNRSLAEIINNRTDSIGYLVTAKMSMNNKIDLLERFVNLEKYHGLKRPKHVAPILRKLRAANTFRNNVAHANWASTQPSGMTRVKIKIDRDNGVWFQNVNLNPTIITQELKKLDELILRMDLIELDM